MHEKPIYPARPVQLCIFGPPMIHWENIGNMEIYGWIDIGQLELSILHFQDMLWLLVTIEIQYM